MMRRITASAPGKMLLLGEYAVLEGAPTLVMAVDRHARVQIDQRLDDSLRICAPALGITDAHAERNARGQLLWQDAEQKNKLQLVEQVLRGLGELELLPESGFAAELDTADFFETAANGVKPAENRQKLGFGSSAALTVALASALAVAAGRGAATANRRVWLEKLLKLHRDFQGGRGSGADIAASLVGGLISYRLRDDGATALPEYRSARLAPPLRLLFVWTGRAAVTSGFLARLEAWRDTQPQAYDAHMQRLGDVAESASNAACQLPADAGALLDAATDYAEALAAFGAASGLEIYTAEHQRLHELGRQNGFVYKPCGAGGGDFGVAFCADENAEQRAIAAIRQAGFAPQQLDVETQGLVLDHQAAPGQPAASPTTQRLSA